MDHVTPPSWGIGPPPPFQGPDVGRHRAELTKRDGVGVTCAKLDGSLKTAHDQVKLLLAREGQEAGLQVEVEVFGAFTRALREADVQRADDYLSTRPGEKQGIIPDLLFGEADFLELKGIRSDGSHSNYNGAPVTGVEKRAAAWLVELREKVVRLDFMYINFFLAL